MIEIYYAPPSIYSRKVLAVLEEKQLDYEIKKMSFSAKDHLKEEYLKLNPNGEVPTLVDDETVIYESTAIIEYLNDEYPEPPLLPEDSAGRAKVRMIEDFCDLHLYRSIVKCLIKKAVDKKELEEEDKAAVAKHVKRIHDYLGKQEWVAGNMFTLADCAVMAALFSIEALGMADLASPTDTMKRYLNKLKQRRGWRGASLVSLETAGSAK